MNYVPPPNKQQYFDQVWELVGQIPYGRVVTYGRLSKQVPKPEHISEEDFQLSASRWVGMAMAASSDDVPWHRVVNSQGKISHPQASLQKKLLLEEGVLFAKDKINLTEFEWQGEGEGSGPSQGRLF